MIYTFAWKDDSNFLKLEALNKWKNQFIEKYSELNFFHFKNIENLNDLTQAILSENFFSEKKLIIIDLVDNEKQEEKEDIWENILNILEKKWENTIVIINYTNPDKRKKFWKNLIKISELKEFIIENENDIKKIINSTFPGKIEQNALDLLIKYKRKIGTIFSELEKIFITKDFITKKDIEEIVIPELEENIFDLTELIFNKKTTEALEKINIILSSQNIFQFYNVLVWILRTNIFIEKLKERKVSNSEIWKILNLWNRTFLIEKKYKMSFSEMKIFYKNLVDIDKKMKTGALTSSEEKDIKDEIEKCLIKS